MVKKFIAIAMMIMIIFSFGACDMGESRTFLLKKYPGAFGTYQYAGYTFNTYVTTSEPSDKGVGVEPEDIFNPEYSELNQEGIYDYIVNALEFTGREVEFTIKTFELKEHGVANYLSPGHKDKITETGFEFTFFEDVNSLQRRYLMDFKVM